RGAEALKMEKLIGSLETGKRADLTVLNMPAYYKSAKQILHHIIHNVTSADVLRTIINGELVTADVSDSDVAKIYNKLNQ
ncbi:amidohydrolase family protein, partial [bacterium]|nr:amidohydrolase family protein [bacterium]